MTLDKDLVERLRATTRGYGAREHMLVNPDGPEAADRIEALSLQGTELREAALEDAAKEADKWAVFACRDLGGNEASRAGEQIASAIRALSRLSSLPLTTEGEG
jgi:hypothetical protein